MAVKAIKPTASAEEIRRTYADATLDELESFKTAIQNDIDELRARKAEIERIVTDRLAAKQVEDVLGDLPEPYATEVRNAMIKASTASAEAAGKTPGEAN